MAQRQKQKTNAPLAIFATLLIVGGVVMVAYVASQTKTLPSVAPSSSTSTPAISSSQAFLVVSTEGLRIVTGDVSTPFRFPEDAAKLGVPASVLEGVRVSSGERVVLDVDAHVVLASNALRSPDGRRTLAVAPFRNDGVGTVTVHYGKESQDIVLRLSNGSPIRSVIPVGWWDERTAAVTGVVTSTRAIFAVSVTGNVERVGFLPDEFDHLSLRHSSAWFTTETPGPGLEAQPMPPATLERIGRDGTHEVVATENAGLISSYDVNASGTSVYAITPQDGSVIDEAPLLIRRDGSVVMHRGTDVVIVHPDGREEEIRGLAGLSTDAAVFALDEIQPNP